MNIYLQGLTMGLAYVAPIGLQNLFVINSALTQRRSRVYLTALIVILWDVSLGVSCFLGAGALMQAVPWLQKVILGLGSLIVIWIGIGLLRSRASLEGGKDVNVPVWKLFTTAFVVTWFNPQAIIDGTMMLGAFRASLPAGGKRKIVLIAAIVLTAAALVYCKYTNFLLDTLNVIASTGFAKLSFLDVLPLGISYYTFKLISYTADVYTGKVKAERSPVVFAVYVLMYPQLIVGPIVKYRDMADVLHQTQGRCTLQKAQDGAEMFVFGLAKKVILADSIAALWQDIIGTGGIGLANASLPLAWLGIIAYSLQLYFDFAGYSEMSNGLSLMMGFECPANFNLPYISGSITEFWRRWHISLSGWFRDYIYIPLGGNRCSAGRQMLNMLAVWALTGIWHGANWNFICWGLYYFVLLVIEKNFLMKYLKKGKVWPHIYTLFLVVLGWGLFTCNAPGAPLGLLLSRLFIPQGGVSALYFLRNYAVLLVVCCVCSTQLPGRFWQWCKGKAPLRAALCGVCFVLCTAYVVAATGSTALYANF